MQSYGDVSSKKSQPWHEYCGALGVSPNISVLYKPRAAHSSYASCYERQPAYHKL